MSVYGAEYQRYYDNLKKENSIKKEIKETTISDYLPRYSSNSYGTGNRRQAKGSSSVNLFIFELVGTLMLVLFIVISKNSTNVEVRGYYNSFESNIKKEGFEIESIIESINKYLDFNESSTIKEENL